VGLWQLVGFLAVGWFGQTQMPVFLQSRNRCNLQSNLSFEWNVAIDRIDFDQRAGHGRVFSIKICAK